MMSSNPNHPEELRERYLADVTQQLRSRQSALETYETTNELRDHINAMAAAYAEVGMDAESAMVAALEKFGAPAQIGTSLAVASSDQNHLNRTTRGISIPFGFLVTTVASIATGALLVGALNLEGLWMHGWRTMPIDLIIEIGAAAGVIVSPFAWWFRKLKPVMFAMCLTCVANVMLAWTLYSTYASLGRFADLVYVALDLSVLFFILGVVASAATRWQLRFGRTRRRTLIV